MSDRSAWGLAVFEHSLDAILITSPDGAIHAANSAACNLFGASEREICALGRAGLVDEADPRLLPALAERARTGRAQTELTMRRRDGATFPADLSSSLFEDQGRTLTCMIIRDITARVQAERELRASEERFRLLFERAPVGIVVADINSGERLVNPAFAAMVGRDTEELARIGPLPITHPADRAEHLHIMVRSAAGALDGYRFEKRYLRPDGTEVWADIQVAVIRDAEGKPLQRLNLIYDLSKRRAADAERDALIAELREALGTVRTLRGLLPICASCKRIRDDQDYWHAIESYIEQHSDAIFSHGICPECARRLYPEFVPGLESPPPDAPAPS